MKKLLLFLTLALLMNPVSAFAKETETETKENESSESTEEILPIASVPMNITRKSMPSNLFTDVVYTIKITGTCYTNTSGSASSGSVSKVTATTSHPEFTVQKATAETSVSSGKLRIDVTIKVKYKTGVVFSDSVVVYFDPRGM